MLVASRRAGYAEASCTIGESVCPEGPVRRVNGTNRQERKATARTVFCVQFNVVVKGENNSRC